MPKKEKEIIGGHMTSTLQMLKASEELDEALYDAIEAIQEHTDSKAKATITLTLTLQRSGKKGGGVKTTCKVNTKTPPPEANERTLYLDDNNMLQMDDVRQGKFEFSGPQSSTDAADADTAPKAKFGT